MVLWFIFFIKGNIYMLLMIIGCVAIGLGVLLLMYAQKRVVETKALKAELLERSTILHKKLEEELFLWENEA